MILERLAIQVIKCILGCWVEKARLDSITRITWNTSPLHVGNARDKWRQSQLLYYSTCTFYAWCPNYLTFNVRTCDRDCHTCGHCHYEYECLSVLFTPIGIEVACIIVMILSSLTWTARNTQSNGCLMSNTEKTGMTRIGEKNTRHLSINKFIDSQAKSLGCRGISISHPQSSADCPYSQ